ncbi:MAG: hypothetical protein DRI34_03140 [Deltaproteobacteria bacterium]|nr:MAG: hypothetical protein DRI34_03140 [Deltaproteobacteria bacterium]
MRPLPVLLALLGLAGSAPADSPSRSELVELGHRCQQRAEQLRGIRAGKPIRWQVADRQQIRAYVLKVLERQYRPGELQAEGLTFRALDLLPADLEYDKFVVDLMTEQIGGVYDPVEEIFYLADWIPPGMQETIIVHEVTHALQDQAYGIDDFLERLRGNSDAMAARAAVVEGEATLVMLEDALRQAGTPLGLEQIELSLRGMQLMTLLSSIAFPSFARAPRALRQSLLFPYLQGLRFVVAARRRGGWKIMDRVYASLPASSEQVLHPEKYFDRPDPPTPIEQPGLPGLAGRDWRLVNSDVLGEFGMDLLLEQLPEQERRRAAAGWDGDRLWVFARGDLLAWVSLSVWDSPADAIQFAGALARTVRERRPGARAEPIGPTPRMVWRLPGDRVIWIERRRQRVAVVFALERAAARAIISDFFRAIIEK